MKLLNPTKASHRVGLTFGYGTSAWQPLGGPPAQFAASAATRDEAIQTSLGYGNHMRNRWDIRLLTGKVLCVTDALSAMIELGQTITPRSMIAVVNSIDDEIVKKHYCSRLCYLHRQSERNHLHTMLHRTNCRCTQYSVMSLPACAFQATENDNSIIRRCACCLVLQ